MDDVTSENNWRVEKVAEMVTFCFFSMLRVILLTLTPATKVPMICLNKFYLRRINFVKFYIKASEKDQYSPHYRGLRCRRPREVR